MRRAKTELLWVVVGCMAVMACANRVVMHTYRNIPAEGWDQSDVLTFEVDTMRSSETVKMDIGVRTTNDYPYQKLWIVAETELHNPDTTFTDTVVCTFVDRNGVRNGKGTDTYQYNFHVGERQLNEGQCGRIMIHHIMRREIIPGICDIGVRLYR